MHTTNPEVHVLLAEEANNDNKTDSMPIETKDVVHMNTTGKYRDMKTVCKQERRDLDPELPSEASGPERCRRLCR